MWFFVIILFCRTPFFFISLFLSTSFIHLYLFQPTFVIERSAFFYVTKFCKKYFESPQDIIKLLLTWTLTTIDFSYQANEESLQRVFLLLEVLNTRISYTRSKLESEMSGECSASCLIHNSTGAVCNWENRENLSTSLLPGLCQRGKVKVSGSHVSSVNCTAYVENWWKLDECFILALLSVYFLQLFLMLCYYCTSRLPLKTLFDHVCLYTC